MMEGPDHQDETLQGERRAKVRKLCCFALVKNGGNIQNEKHHQNPEVGWLIKIQYMCVSKNRVFSPQIIHFNRVFHYKPSILGYHYFWKHPYGLVWFGLVWFGLVWFGCFMRIYIF